MNAVSKTLAASRQTWLIYSVALLLAVALTGCASSSAPQTSTPPLTDAITLETVAQHATQNDCWMVINGDVYDVTDYVSRHPGGREILLGCGKDATDLFNSRPGDGSSHSSTARAQLPGLKIGTIAQ